MDLRYSRDFLKSARLAPGLIQKKLAADLEILRENPFDPRLRTKPLAGKLSGFYSFRITREWRAIFKFIDSNTIFLIDVAHRKDIYR